MQYFLYVCIVYILLQEMIQIIIKKNTFCINSDVIYFFKNLGGRAVLKVYEHFF